MNTTFNHELSESLAAAVNGVNNVPANAISTAQERLMVRLHDTPHAKPARSRSWLAFAAMASLALVISVMGPMMSGGGVAFAAVQKHFLAFDSMVMSVTQRFNGRVVQSSETIVNAEGVTRTNVGEQLSIIVDPQQGRVLTLLHEPQQAMLVQIPKSQPVPKNELQWLEELRNFKGQATPLPKTRMIRGDTAYGWALNLSGLQMEIWANAEGLPLEMRQLGGAGLTLEYQFTFDELNADVDKQLSIVPPSGYTLVQPDSD
jgi:hypothetical protein